MSRNTGAERTCDLYEQLMEKGKDVVPSSLCCGREHDASDAVRVHPPGGLKPVCHGGAFGIYIHARHNHREGNL